ncbi:hypothetical protein [Oryzobacter telluris]|uniref:hypothetical protein n=1 Tax=Oryzobacter telluris TaxID=3149179 RepID=UPI00370DCAD5
MDLEEIARELYALPPAEFTAARNARSATVRAEGDRGLAEEVKRLRRPSVGAWVLDLLAREHPQDVVPVVELGGRLREAMGVLGAEDLRALDRQRRELTRAVAAQAAAHAEAAGQPVNGAVTAAVEESLRAAMVDEPAGRALLTGLLTDTFTTTGLDPVDLSRVLAVPSLVPARMAAVPQRAEASEGAKEVRAGAPAAEDGSAARRAVLVAARAALREAEDARAAAEETAAAAARRATKARTSRLELETRRDELVRALRAAETALTSAVTAEASAEDALEAADGEAERSREAAAQARSHLDTAVEHGP